MAGERGSAAAWCEGSRRPHPASADQHQTVGTSGKPTSKIFRSVGETGRGTGGQWLTFMFLFESSSQTLEPFRAEGGQGDFCDNKGLFVKGLLDPSLFY